MSKSSQTYRSMKDIKFICYDKTLLSVSLSVFLSFFLSFFRRDTPAVFKCEYMKEGSMSTVDTRLLSYSYMFRLYIYSHHQAGYRTLSKKTIKIK